MSDHRHPLRSALRALPFAAAAAALLAGCQSPRVNEVHKFAIDRVPPAYLQHAGDEAQAGVWRLADAAYRAQQRTRERSSGTNVADREVHAAHRADRALHTTSAEPKSASDGERSLIAAR